MIDELSLQRNKPFILKNGLTLKQPTLDEIIDLGYDKYSDYLSAIILTPKDVADVLWCQMKVWYEDIESDWKFFLENSLVGARSVNLYIENDMIEGVGVSEGLKNALNFFFDRDCEYVIMDKKQEEGGLTQVFIVGAEYIDDTRTACTVKTTDFKIYEDIYNEMVMFLKSANWSTFEYEFTKGGTKKAKKYILEHDYRARKKQKKTNITLGSIVSSLIAKGQSYNDIWGFPIYMIYDLYYRYIKIDDWNNTMRALHSGCIDTKKNPINWEKINWSSITTKK